jgi:hypothetical protein
MRHSTELHERSWSRCFNRCFYFRGPRFISWSILLLFLMMILMVPPISPAYCGVNTWTSFMSRNMTVSVVTRPWVRQWCNRGSIPGKVKKIFSPSNCPPNLLRSGYVDVKRPNQEADHSPTPMSISRISLAIFHGCLRETQKKIPSFRFHAICRTTYSLSPMPSWRQQGQHYCKSTLAF